MNYKAFRIIIIFLVFIECDTDTSICRYEGQIVGYDGTECGCCPGWLIKANDDSIKILSLPSEVNLWEVARNKGYPIPIEIEYRNFEGDCDQYYKELVCFNLK